MVEATHRGEVMTPEPHMGMEHRELTEKIIGCAFRVYNRMGFGFAEAVYENCMLIELRRAGLKAEPQKAITVHYDGIVVGEYFADILVEDALPENWWPESALTATGKPVGLLLNFGEHGVEVARKVRKLPKEKPTQSS
jgi:hypothetical protein